MFQYSSFKIIVLLGLTIIDITSHYIQTGTPKQITGGHNMAQNRILGRITKNTQF